jgi:hypothetical protein
MTRDELQLLTARVERLRRAVGCLGAFQSCYWATDLAKAEKTLQEALESKPNPNL